MTAPTGDAATTARDTSDELRAATEEKARADQRWHYLLHRDWNAPGAVRSTVADAAGLNRATAYHHMRHCTRQTATTDAS